MKKPILRLKNRIEVLATTGDTDALEYGGGILYKEPRYGDIYWTFWEEKTRGSKNYEVFTAPIPEDIIEHFDPDLEELEMVSGTTKKDAKKMSSSKNPVERLELVMALKDCSGPSSIDPNKYPEEVSPFEMVSRWGELYGIDLDSVPMVDFEDYMIRESRGGKYECGGVDGKYLGKYRNFNDALAAVADRMHETMDFSANLFFEHEFGKLELVSWEPQRHIGKSKPIRGKLPEAPWRSLMKKYMRSEERRGSVNQRLKSHKQVSRHQKMEMTKRTRESRISRARAFRKKATKGN